MNIYLDIFKRYYPHIANGDNFGAIRKFCEYFHETDIGFFDPLTVVKLIPLIINSQSQFMVENPKDAAEIYNNLEWALKPETDLNPDQLADIYNMCLYPEDYYNRFTEALDTYIEYVVLAEAAKDGELSENEDDIEEAYTIAEAIVCQAILYFRSITKVVNYH